MAKPVIQILSDGRLSLDIRKLAPLLNEAVMSRIMNEENLVVKAVLEELRVKLTLVPTRVKLRQSEWLALMAPETLCNLDEYEQAYLVSVLLDKKTLPKLSDRPAIFPKEFIRSPLVSTWFLK